MKVFLLKLIDNFLNKKLINDIQIIKAYSVIFLMIILCISKSTHAEMGGIALGKNRIIFPASDVSQSITVTNSSKSTHYIIQSWIEDSNGVKTDEFVITPPIYKSGAGDKNDIKIINVLLEKPVQKEKIYYLNVKSIPSLKKDSIFGKNVMIVTATSRIKIFVRPEHLPIDSMEALKKIFFHVGRHGVMANNPTPYYITMIDLRADNKSIRDVMIHPYGDTMIYRGNANTITYHVINDFGGVSDKIIKKVNQFPP